MALIEMSFREIAFALLEMSFHGMAFGIALESIVCEGTVSLGEQGSLSKGLSPASLFLGNTDMAFREMPLLEMSFQVSRDGIQFRVRVHSVPRGMVFLAEGEGQYGRRRGGGERETGEREGGEREGGERESTGYEPLVQHGRGFLGNSPLYGLVLRFGVTPRLSVSRENECVHSVRRGMVFLAEGEGQHGRGLMGTGVPRS